MKTLIVYYSYTGHAKARAEALAAAESADIAEIKDVQRPGKLKAYSVGCFTAMRGKAWPIRPLNADLAAHDRLILLSPTWAGSPPPTLHALLAQLPKGKAVSVKMVSASGKSGCKERVEAAVKARGCTLESFEDYKNQHSEGAIKSMNTIEAIHTRYSCRAFTDKMPPNEDLQTIAEAAVAAPSGMNRQLWRVVVVKNQQLLADLESEGMKNLAMLPDKSLVERIQSRGGKLYYNTPCMIVVPIGKVEPSGAELFDCGIVAENIALAATSLGIDNLICGLAAFSFAGERGEGFKRRLSFPEGYEIGIAVLLGYAENPGGKPHEPDLSKITMIE